jgi:hypothetical protein
MAQHQARQLIPFYQNREFIQGKLEIQEDIRIKFGKITHELYPETILMLDTLLCEWTRDNYSEMVQFLHQDAFTEYEDSHKLSDIFYDKFIAVSSSLIEFTINSGIIENHRVSIYLYCCDAMTLNIDHADQNDEEGKFDIRNDQEMAHYLLICYYNTAEILVNEFIEIRDSLGLK